jgi:type I restriction enzyme S subunit
VRREGATRTGGRSATTGVIPGRWALSVGIPPSAPPKGFIWRRLDELARLESGHTPSRRVPEYWNGDVPWIGIRDATANHGRTIRDTNEHVSKLGIENSSARLLPPETVCLSRTASVGYVVMTDREMATSQDFVNWVCGPNLLPRYLFYVLIAEQESIRRFAHGTTHQTMYYPEAKALAVLIPDLPEQRSIVKVLGALDDKIEANRLLVQLCDATWRTALEAIENGALHQLSSLAQFINGRAFTKGASGAGRVVVRIAELNGDPGPSTVYNDIEVPEEHMARPGDLLFAWSGSLTVRRWYRPAAIVNQHIFKVVPRPSVPVWFVHACLLKVLPLFRGIAADKATTMGHIQRHHLDEPVLVPEPEQLDALDQYCGPLWERALAAERESLTLSALRDTLLPKLLAGELRVRDAELAVSEAV